MVTLLGLDEALEEPVEPVEPDEPVEPVDPVDPVVPDEPDEPEEPEEPEVLVTGVWPELPVPELPEVLELALAATCAVVVACEASAGSRPEISTTAIHTHVATNTATAPAITRRRIVRVRAARASRFACGLAEFMPMRLTRRPTSGVRSS